MLDDREKKHQALNGQYRCLVAVFALVFAKALAAVIANSSEDQNQAYQQ
jgi:hypothetical protein